MSEKIYAWLLRLYPSHFRKAYGDAALQLFRDRARHEKGFFLRVRLWLDVLGDLALSVPREYRYAQPALIRASALHRVDGVPSFYVLGDESPGLGALLFGFVLSLSALGMFSVLLAQPGNHRPLGTSVYQRQRAADARRSVFRRPTAQSADNIEDGIVASISQPPQLIGAIHLIPDEAKIKPSQSNALVPRESFPSSQARSPRPADLASPRVGTPVEGLKFDTAERRRVTEAVIQNIKNHYIDSEVAQKTANVLLAHEKNGDDDKVTEGGALADLLTRQVREVSHDMHLEVVYSEEPLPDLLPEPTAEDLARYRKAMEQDNCTFRKVEILAHNIGYLKLNSFPDASVCLTTATAAMASLNHADAVIFDLRENRGGYANMVSLIAAYLFDHPEYMYDPRESPTQQSWTRSPVAGNKLADKPVYVLTSASTVSAAEQFCYDLKMLKRVTLVGETTRGSTHAGVFHRIDNHFGMGIPEVRAVNPYSKSDWEATGVEPDVKVKAMDALETAEKLAESRLRKK
jgi:Peptidase family S41/N-terminal domain of Peptidase_S41 in eukaryotic IRBP